MTSFRSFVWKIGVMGFGLPLALIVWLSVVVDELGWRGLWSVPALLGLGAALLVGGSMGCLFGIVFWWLFGDAE